MIITEQKPLNEILKYLDKEKKIFLFGCGECSTTCKAGGEEQIKQLIEQLKNNKKQVTGFSIPDAPCIASQVRISFLKSKRQIQEADSILVMTCGLGVQSIKENVDTDIVIHPGCNTLFIGAVDKTGLEFFQYCSTCGDCLLEYTGGMCPVTRCSKGLLNGPCGGMNEGKCEVDKERDCIWVVIYNQLKDRQKLDSIKQIKPPRDFSKIKFPQTLILNENRG